MSFLKKLFGGGAPAAAVDPMSREPDEVYEGVEIRATPMPADGQFRLCAMMTKTVDGATLEHRLIRADLFPSADAAASAAISKARQVIDQQGDSVFA